VRNKNSPLLTKIEITFTEQRSVRCVSGPVRFYRARDVAGRFLLNRFLLVYIQFRLISFIEVRFCFFSLVLSHSLLTS
jgi:hypothetical protein